VDEHSTRRGRCGYCRARSVPVIEVHELCDAFQNMVARYTRRDESLDTLMYLVQGDYEPFSERLYGDEGADAVELMNDILITGWDDDDGEPPIDAGDYYSTRGGDYHETQAERWAEFSHYVKENPDMAPPLNEIFGEDVVRAEAVLGAGTLLWRSRKGFSENPDGQREAYTGDAIGPPPAHRTGEMRASKKGEVVFYCADGESTAIAELRPATGHIVSVGRFRTVRDVRIVDLTKRIDINPFTEESLAWFEEFADLLAAFAEQLSRPLERDDDTSDYVPCQKIADAIRAEHFAGIRYPSAMHPDGTNIVLFDPSAVELVDSRMVRVSNVVVEYQEHADE
jgi:RES domain-containing protein